jgi:leucyl aminopeptidase
MSAIKAGYPATYVFESDFALANQHVHTPEDLIKHLDFSHMIDHARMTLGFVYELAFADLQAESGRS